MARRGGNQDYSPGKSNFVFIHFGFDLQCQKIPTAKHRRKLFIKYIKYLSRP